MTVRAFPGVPFPRARCGQCPWCGETTIDHTGKRAGQVSRTRMYHDGRHGEPDCAAQKALHTVPAVQYAHLVERDGERCYECGARPMVVRRGHAQRDRASAPGEGYFTEVRFRVALEIEHAIPLWLVAHLPPDERRPYFGPSNLRLFCEPCHKAKTKREAGERAKGERLRDGPRRRRGRELRSRGFDKTHRRRFDGTVETR